MPEAGTGRQGLIWRLLGMATVAAIFVLAITRLVESVDPAAVGRALAGLPAWRLAVAALLTLGSYGLLSLYDVLALRVIGRRIAYRTAALASFTSYTLSHNLGFGVLTGGSARLRIYGSAGLRATEVVRIILLAGTTFWLGAFVLSAGAVLIHPFAIPGLPIPLQHVVALSLLAAVAGLFLLGFAGVRSISLLRWQLELPGPRQVFAMICLAALDLALAASVLFVLLPDASPAMFAPLLGAYLLACIAGLISHIPGGVGVFEATALAALPGVPHAGLLAALLVYRLIYNLLPLTVGIALLVHHEQRAGGPLPALLDTARRIMEQVAPTLIAVLAFGGGLVLLVSGATPTVPSRLAALREVLPLPFVEASHLAASLTGTGLVLLSHALYRRLDAAAILTRLLLLAGAAFSLAKGFDYEEALTLLGLAALLQLNRRAFYRQTALTAEAFSWPWLVAIAGALLVSLGIGYFANKVPISQHALWWQFAGHGDASRSMRAALAALVMTGSYLVVLLHAPARPRPVPADLGFQPETALAQSSRSDAMLALTGDKRFLYGPLGRSFLMYQIQGHTWVMMGDPVGDRADWADLMWRLRELADAAQGRVLLYQISPAILPLAIDLGLNLFKYGEEALVDLASFTLEGPEARSLRYSVRRAQREGAEFELYPAAMVPSLIAELRPVSDRWLATRQGSEKAFSVGRFDPGYLARCDLAVVRREGRIVAFANIWKTPGHEELSVDLMRHIPDLPPGGMDFLFASLMELGQANGFSRFNLGLAPLSGIEARRLAPLWAHACALLFRHGEALYGFEGLRAFKEKFAPTWESRYIAAPSGIALGRALFDLQALVGGGRNSAASRDCLRAAS